MSKYVNILELKNKVYKKKIGAYSLYFSAEETYLPNSLVLSYYKALLKGLKTRYPIKRNEIKEIAADFADEIKFSFSPKIYKQLKNLKAHPISKIHLEIFKNFYPAYDIFQPNIEISILEVDNEGKKAIYRFRNSIFLENNEDYIYHLYFMSGLTQGILSRELKTEVICNIENYHISDDKKDSYFDISLRIK
ncbi:MAG: hypothetical protein GF317_08260 [Candidatus Lokiarchaeota archaeon]|nr:hypothetical protein [Candidatus Lokiarchaeota archaeon]MBD3199704.1 hypothetical protein [Candidatus Lokiarchaeota archaeon]